MHSYSFAAVNGYVIMDVHGMRALLDTGAPYTFGSAPAWQFLGRRRDLNGPVMSPCSTEAIGRHAGTRIDVLVGMDVLAEAPFEIDWPGRTVTFAPEREARGQTVPLDITLGGPVLEGKVLGCARRLSVNTGATIGFLPEQALRGTRPVGLQQGFLPTVGAYETQVHSATLQIAGSAVDLLWGRLPGIMGVHLLIAGGMVGSPLLEQYRTRFDLAGRRLTLAAYHPAAALSTRSS